MDDIHLSREILRAVHHGKVPQNVLDEIKTEHLLSRCPHCRAVVQAYEAELKLGPSVFSRISIWRSFIYGRDGGRKSAGLPRR